METPKMGGWGGGLIVEINNSFNLLYINFL